MKDKIKKQAHVYEWVFYCCQVILMGWFIFSLFYSVWWWSVLLFIGSFKCYVLRLVFMRLLKDRIIELINRDPFEVLKSLPLSGRQRRRIRREFERKGILQKSVDGVFNED